MQAKTQAKTLSALKKEWLKNPEVRAAYESMEVEFHIAGLLIEARKKARMTQAELAKRMNSTQAHVSRLESASYLPSLTSIMLYCQAVGQKIRIDIDPKMQIRVLKTP
jgi:DNA-binding XRE family transcriptional regulator